MNETVKKVFGIPSTCDTNHGTLHKETDTRYGCFTCDKTFKITEMIDFIIKRLHEWIINDKNQQEQMRAEYNIAHFRGRISALQDAKALIEMLQRENDPDE